MWSTRIMQVYGTERVEITLFPISNNFKKWRPTINSSFPSSSASARHCGDDDVRVMVMVMVMMMVMVM